MARLTATVFALLGLAGVEAWTPAPLSRGTTSRLSKERRWKSPRGTALAALTDLASEKAFDDVIKEAKDKLVVVDFATTWCGPCKVMEPKITAMSEEYTGAQFYKVIGDSSSEASALMKREGVRAVPSFHFWKNGERVDVVNGANIDAVRTNVAKYL